MTAASRSRVGARPLAVIAACWTPRQLSLLAINAPDRLRISRTGSGSPASPFKDGPMPRMSNRFADVVRTMKPAMPTPLPARTGTRVEILASSMVGGVPEGAGEALGRGVAFGAGAGGGKAE